MGNMLVTFSRHRNLPFFNPGCALFTIQPLCLMFRAELEIDPAHRVLRQYEANIIWISQELFGPLGARDMI